MAARSTTIHANGSKLYGEQPNSIEHLLYALTCGHYILDPIYEEHGGDFISVNELSKQVGLEHTCFWGNFQNLSHVFNICSNDPEVIEKITKAIRANQALPAYQVWKKKRAQLIAEHEHKKLTATEGANLNG